MAFSLSCVCVINGDSGWRRIRSSHVRWLIVISADAEGLRCIQNAKFIALIRTHYIELKSPQTEADRSKRTLNKQRQRTEKSAEGCRRKSARPISIAAAMNWSDRCQLLFDAAAAAARVRERVNAVESVRKNSHASTIDPNENAKNELNISIKSGSQ